MKTSTPRRLLFVVNSTRYFCLHRLSLAIAARNHGFEVGVLASGVDQESVSKIIAEGFRFFDFALISRNINPLKEMRTVGRLIKAFREFKPDLVHCLTIKSVIYSGIYCRLFKLPMLALIPGRGSAFSHIGWKGWTMKNIATQLYRVALKRPEFRVCFQNNDDLEFFQKLEIVRSNQAFLIAGSGVDLKTFSFRPYNIGKVDRVIVFVSRMLKEKGVYEYIKAAKQIEARGMPAEFLLVGSPDPSNPSSLSEQEILKEIGESKAIRYLGHRSDIPQILQSSDIFCFPSFYGEGVPKAILEAQACGLPVVTTRTPGCRDVVSHGTTGLLVEPKDVYALTESLILLLKDKSLAFEISANAYREIQKHHEISKINGKYLSIYDSLTSPGRSNEEGSYEVKHRQERSSAMHQS